MECIELDVFCDSQPGGPLILRDGNGAIYPVAKDCLEGIRDPLWLDLPPLVSLGMTLQSVPSASLKNRVAVIALAVEVRWKDLVEVL